MVARYGVSYKWLVMIAGLLGSMSMVLSATMVNVAIPSIMGAYGVGQDLAQWAATAFLTLCSPGTGRLNSKASPDMYIFNLLSVSSTMYLALTFASSVKPKLII